MEQQHHHKQKTIRLTIDLPKDQHTYITMLAAKKGITIKEFVIGYLPSLEGNKEEHRNIRKDKFDQLLNELLVEESDVLKRLAKK